MNSEDIKKQIVKTQDRIVSRENEFDEKQRDFVSLNQLIYVAKAADKDSPKEKKERDALKEQMSDLTGEIGVLKQRLVEEQNQHAAQTEIERIDLLRKTYKELVSSAPILTKKYITYADFYKATREECRLHDKQLWETVKAMPVEDGIDKAAINTALVDIDTIDAAVYKEEAEKAMAPLRKIWAAQEARQKAEIEISRERAIALEKAARANRPATKHRL